MVAVKMSISRYGVSAEKVDVVHNGLEFISFLTYDPFVSSIPIEKTIDNKVIIARAGLEGEEISGSFRDAIKPKRIFISFRF